MIPPPPMSLPRALILAHHRGEASINDVLRGFMGHREWLVPIGFFPRPVLRDAYKVSFGPRHQCPPGEMWLFSEQGTAQHAATQGAILGAFVLGVNGCDLFANMSEEVRLIRVNPAGYPEDHFVIARETFPEVSTWAQIVELEESLRTNSDPAHDGHLLGRLHRHPEYYVPLLPDGRMLAKPGEGGFAQPGVVCTSPDSYDMFLAALDPQLRGQIVRTVLDGPALTQEVRRQDVDAIYLNPFGPGPTATWPRAIADLIANS